MYKSIIQQQHHDILFYVSMWFSIGILFNGFGSVNSEANSRRIAYVEQCFGASGQPLQVTGRVLVGEGVLTKLCRKKPKPRQFFLFNDIIVYGNILINKKKYNQQHIIPLEVVKLENVDDQANLRNGWKIISPSKSFVVFAATATEKSQWMSHINKCVSDLLLKNIEGTNDSSGEDSSDDEEGDGAADIAKNDPATQFHTYSDN
ncbi:hypothetical protein KUTeg_022626 [Tegillarca granosa]|uniref:PH domain-containing protein n=1 Tax=Tegillarca granosa TaxID=220873 RepID=A0ABQ9DZ99_TEGGR|nr:hypothetical protein KUTeg_022626 [Tegillarca granosa]